MRMFRRISVFLAAVLGLVFRYSVLSVRCPIFTPPPRRIGVFWPDATCGRCLWILGVVLGAWASAWGLVGDWNTKWGGSISIFGVRHLTSPLSPHSFIFLFIFYKKQNNIENKNVALCYTVLFLWWKRTKKSRLYSNPTILVQFPAGSYPKLTPPASGLEQGYSQPPPIDQNRDLNKAGHNFCAAILIAKCAESCSSYHRCLLTRCNLREMFVNIGRRAVLFCLVTTPSRALGQVYEA